MSEAKISLIVPVYNTEKYLRMCLDSISAQTFKNFECILVNDGSKDNSLALLKEYAEKDERFVIVDQPNKGLSAVRNVGIEHSSADFICFLDSDDKVNEHYLEHLYYPQADLVISGIDVMDFCSMSRIDGTLPKRREMLKFDYAAAEYGMRNSLYFNTVGKCYKKSIITNNNLRFDSRLVSAEDYIFNIQYLMHCKDLYFVDSADYMYFMYGTNTTLSSSFSERKYEDKLKVDVMVEKLFADRFGKGVSEFTNMQFWHTFETYIFSCASSNMKKNEKIEFINRVFAEDKYRELVKNISQYSKQSKKVQFILKLKNAWLLLAAKKIFGR